MSNNNSFFLYFYVVLYTIFDSFESIISIIIFGHLSFELEIKGVSIIIGNIKYSSVSLDSSLQIVSAQNSLILTKFEKNLIIFLLLRVCKSLIKIVIKEELILSFC